MKQGEVLVRYLSTVLTAVPTLLTRRSSLLFNQKRKDKKQEVLERYLRSVLTAALTQD